MLLGNKRELKTISVEFVSRKTITTDVLIATTNRNHCNKNLYSNNSPTNVIVQLHKCLIRIKIRCNIPAIAMVIQPLQEKAQLQVQFLVVNQMCGGSMLSSPQLTTQHGLITIEHLLWGTVCWSIRSAPCLRSSWYSRKCSDPS